jgi:hypothetical protein
MLLTMITIPVAIVAASISASVYMAFLWRPPVPKRVKIITISGGKLRAR